MRTMNMRKSLVVIGCGLMMCMLVAKPDLSAAGETETTLDPLLTASQVVSRMMEMTDQRTEALRGYTSLRDYHLEMHGVIHLRADMEVQMKYRYPGVKEFAILSESGSAYVRDHIFKRIIEAENQASQQDENRHVAITPENYTFDLAGFESSDQGRLYILEVKPRIKSKYLFKGRIWVDDQSFSIVRIEGQPSKSLSWWTPKINFKYQYKKIGEFWLPASNKTVTHVRVFGRSLLTIDYKDYNLTDARSVQPPGTAKAILKD